MFDVIIINEKGAFKYLNGKRMEVGSHEGFPHIHERFVTVLEKEDGQPARGIDTPYGNYVFADLDAALAFVKRAINHQTKRQNRVNAGRWKQIGQNILNWAQVHDVTISPEFIELVNN